MFSSKKAQGISLAILGIVAVIAVVGLVLLFSGAKAPASQTVVMKVPVATGRAIGGGGPEPIFVTAGNQINFQVPMTLTNQRVEVKGNPSGSMRAELVGDGTRFSVDGVLLFQGTSPDHTQEVNLNSQLGPFVLQEYTISTGQAFSIASDSRLPIREIKVESGVTPKGAVRGEIITIYVTGLGAGQEALDQVYGEARSAGAQVKFAGIFVGGIEMTQAKVEFAPGVYILTGNLQKAAARRPDLVAVSVDSTDEAVQNAIFRATATLRALDWFEVTQVRSTFESLPGMRIIDIEPPVGTVCAQVDPSNWFCDTDGFTLQVDPSQTITIVVEPLLVGPSGLRFRVDPDNQIPESNEGNNEAQKTVTVNEPRFVGTTFDGTIFSIARVTTTLLFPFVNVENSAGFDAGIQCIEHGQGFQSFTVVPSGTTGQLRFPYAATFTCTEVNSGAVLTVDVTA